MIWKITKKDLLLNVMTFKFLVGTIVCVVLTAVLMPVLLSDYQRRWKEYHDNIAADEAELQAAKVYDNIKSNRRIYRPPTALSVFSKGIESQVNDSAGISRYSIPELDGGAVAVNPYLAILQSLDLSLLYRTVLSLLAVLIACDAVSGERATGTLMLTASGTVARYQVLLGKTLAGLMTLAVPLTMAFLVAILMLSFSPAVELAGSDWIRMGIMYLASLLFILAVFNGGLLISCSTNYPTTSLMLGLFLWIVLAMIVPNADGYLATQIRPLEPAEPMNAQLRSLEETYSFRSADAGDKIPLAGHGIEHEEKPFRRYTLVCDKEYIDSLIKRNAVREAVWADYLDKSWQIEHSYIERLLQQERLAVSLSRVSPVCTYENMMSALAGTNTASCQGFIDAARTHRREVFDYVQAKTDNEQSPSLYTPCTTADQQQYQQYLDKKMSEEEFQQWKDRRIANLQPLDLQDYPRFAYKGNILSDLRAATLDLCVLVFANALFFSLAFVAFMKYDVR
jgi:ABC-type transport system involved in multi-copper enzyme maturation permease subunit